MDLHILPLICHYHHLNACFPRDSQFSTSFVATTHILQSYSSYYCFLISLVPCINSCYWKCYIFSFVFSTFLCFPWISTSRATRSPHKILWESIIYICIYPMITSMAISFVIGHMWCAPLWHLGFSSLGKIINLVEVNKRISWFEICVFFVSYSLGC